MRCPLCKCRNINLKIQDKNLQIYRCPNCSLEFIDKKLSKKELQKLYSRDYFTNQLKGVGGYKDYNSLTKELTAEAEKRLDFISKFTANKKILDVGAGGGVFLQTAQKRGYKTYGNDISPFARDAFAKSKIPFFYGSIGKGLFGKNRFDIITAWDVFEHVSDIQQVTMTLSSLLTPGGFLFLTTPNTKSWDAKLLGKRWYGYQKAPEHLTFFNKKSIKIILEFNGLKLVQVQSWGFVRSIDFIVEKMESYFPWCGLLRKVPGFEFVRKRTFFFPLTDFMVVAQKVNQN